MKSQNVGTERQPHCLRGRVKDSFRLYSKCQRQPQSKISYMLDIFRIGNLSFCCAASWRSKLKSHCAPSLEIRKLNFCELAHLNIYKVSCDPASVTFLLIPAPPPSQGSCDPASVTFLLIPALPPSTVENPQKCTHPNCIPAQRSSLGPPPGGQHRT